MTAELPNQCEGPVSPGGDQLDLRQPELHQANHIHEDTAFFRTPRKTSQAQREVAPQSLQKMGPTNVILPSPLPGLTEYSPRGAL